MTFSGEIIPAELMKFFTIPQITRSEGSFRLNMKLSGNLVTKEKYTLSDFIDLNPEADVQFNSFGIGLKNRNLVIDDVDGNIMFAHNLWAEDLVFSLNGQRFKINGEFKNLPAWIAGKAVQVKAIADVSIGNLKPESFMTDSVSGVQSKKTSYNLPAGFDLQITFKIENLVYRTFTAGNISGILYYKPGIINIKSLNLNSLNGSISGEGFLAQNPGKSFIGKGNFNIENVDVNLAFKSFKNFNQDFLKAENLAGSLSGTLSLLLPLDSLLYPDFKNVTAEGKYTIINGALINFEPVKALSRFIKLSELENITFSKLENDLFIRNNYLAVPQMEIKSSAADFTVSGKHDFNNNYEYHVKTYLSEVLSRKARKGSQYNTEFGVVEEDGLGRSSIYLKVTGNGEDLKVVPDLKATVGSIKQNLKNEKSNLKNILNEEYGWFKKDSTMKQEPAPRPKFRIEWSETDTTRVQKDTTVVEKNKLINRIFKKKKTD
jgi:AsmA-like C-terminal region